MFNFVCDTFVHVKTKLCRNLCDILNMYLYSCTKWSVVAERSSALDSSSDVGRMWVRIPAWPVAVLVSFKSKTLICNHNCFVLRMGCKAVGPVCCVMYVREGGLPRCFWIRALSTQHGGYYYY